MQMKAQNVSKVSGKFNSWIMKGLNNINCSVEYSVAKEYLVLIFSFLQNHFSFLQQPNKNISNPYSHSFIFLLGRIFLFVYTLLNQQHPETVLLEVMYWHERQSCSLLLFRWLLAATLVDHYFHHYFLLSFKIQLQFQLASLAELSQP